MKRLLLAAAPAFALISWGSYAALNAQAAPASPPGKIDPARVTAGHYTVDGGHTLVGWRVSHWSISDYFGIFGDVAGTLHLDPQDLAATKLDVTIPVTKVTVASVGLRDHMVRPGKDGAKPDFFGPDMADARFVSAAIRRTGPLKADITGDLTLNGITRPVTLAAEFTGAGPHPRNNTLNIGFKARAAIMRSEFGLAYGVPTVSDRVELDITAAFEKAESTAAEDGCGAAKAGDAIGRKDTAELRSEVARKIGHGRVRWLPPGSIVTQDLRSDRLNVDLDAGGVVIRLRCG